MCILNKCIKKLERRSAGASLNILVDLNSMTLHVVREKVWTLGTWTGHEG